MRGKLHKRRVLVVEDNAHLSQLIGLHLRDSGCSVTLARDGLQGLQAARESVHDLVILDVMLPGVDGYAVCRSLREERPGLPIFMLTSLVQEDDRVRGLETGADDYITKPFSMRELVARVRAAFRRLDCSEAPDAGKISTIEFGPVFVDLLRRLAIVRGREIALTATEFDLLAYLMAHPGVVFTRDQLLDGVWGRHFEGSEHTVNSHINRLRMKIEKDPRKPDFVLTQWGVGYKFAEAWRR